MNIYLFNRSKEKEFKFNRFIKNLDIGTNFSKIELDLKDLFAPSRVEFKIDVAAVEQVEKALENTVEVLNTYLDEGELETDLVIPTIISPEIKKPTSIVNEPKEYLKNGNLFALNDAQKELLDKMSTSVEFTIMQSEAEQVALKHKVFKNQLIDSINDLFSDFLEGDVLIEEEGAVYILEKDYYKDIQENENKI